MKEVRMIRLMAAAGLLALMAVSQGCGSNESDSEPVKLDSTLWNTESGNSQSLEGMAFEEKVQFLERAAADPATEPETFVSQVNMVTAQSASHGGDGALMARVERLNALSSLMQARMQPQDDENLESDWLRFGASASSDEGVAWSYSLGQAEVSRE